VAPPEWRPATIGDALTMALVRRVDTPDGALTQGLVLDRAAVADWLSERADHRTVSLVAAIDRKAHHATAPLAAGAWRVAVDLRAAEAAAARAGADVERAFLGRLVPIALLALLCGGLVIIVVAGAERTAQQRARFAAAAAHELRTPLAGLQLYGDMLADGLGDPGKQRDYARRMAEEASRLGRVVSNVLGFSQLERGNLSVHAVAADVPAVIRSAVERAAPALERAGATVVLVEPDAPIAARLDEDAVVRIVANLLDNAEKYSRGADDRTVRVAISRTGDAVEIAIADAGPGVPERQRRRLFRPFWRGADSDGPAGLGLGLALSRSLARAMGGELELRPSSRGATFVLRLAAA
jgi:signal transduction histidine kinase